MTIIFILVSFSQVVVPLLACLGANIYSQRAQLNINHTVSTAAEPDLIKRQFTGEATKKGGQKQMN